jgi:hypothetical protein
MTNPLPIMNLKARLLQAIFFAAPGGLINCGPTVVTPTSTASLRTNYYTTTIVDLPMPTNTRVYAPFLHPREADRASWTHYNKLALAQYLSPEAFLQLPIIELRAVLQHWGV